MWKSAFFYSLKSGAPPGDSGNHPYRPSPSDHSAITSNPLIPACVLLLVLLLIITSVPAQYWSNAADSLPRLAELFMTSGKKPSNILPKTSDNVSVWTKKQFGFYYCQDGDLYGSKPGELMTQAEALTSGYRPAGGQYCTSSEPNAVSAEGMSPQPRNPPESVQNTPHSLDPLLAVIQRKPSDLPKAIQSARVWSKKNFGLYFCQGDPLYGSKPGKLMTQAEALKSGNLPADGKYCTSNNRNKLSTRSLPLGAASEMGP